MRVTFSLCGSPKPSRQISRNGLTAQNTTACAEERGDSAGRLCHEEEARTSRASTHDVGRGAPGRSLPTIAIITRSRSGPRTTSKVDRLLYAGNNLKKARELFAAAISAKTKAPVSWLAGAKIRSGVVN
jgi:hypothetical protein